LLTLIGFFDLAYGRVHDPAVGSDRTDTLMGVGAGFQVKLTKYLAAKFEWGVPLVDDPNTESGHSQFHFRLSADV